jgi:hypothetical protein
LRGLIVRAPVLGKRLEDFDRALVVAAGQRHHAIGGGTLCLGLGDGAKQERRHEQIPATHQCFPCQGITAVRGDGPAVISYSASPVEVTRDERTHHVS